MVFTSEIDASIVESELQLVYSIWTYPSLKFVCSRKEGGIVELTALVTTTIVNM